MIRNHESLAIVRNTVSNLLQPMEIHGGKLKINDTCVSVAIFLITHNKMIWLNRIQSILHQ